MYYVYLIKSISQPNKTYIGHTAHLKQRLETHNSGGSLHTMHDRPWELVMFFGFKDKLKATAFEKYLNLMEALIHAIVDALLGAASLGDIGLLYPNTDSRWKDAPSSIFLSETATRLRDLGWTIRHIDATVIAERPKVMPRRDEICQRISELLGVPSTSVSVKATTNEGLGSIGRGEGLSAFAVATITKF